MSLHRLVMAAAVAAAAAVGATFAHAETASHPEIDGVDVEQVAEITPGTSLHFSVYGTTGAVATLRIEGGWRLLALQESTPGVYEGVYVVDSRDAIGPHSRATATLQHAGGLARADLDEPLLLAATPLPWAAAAAVAGRTPPSPTEAKRGTPVPAAVIASPPLTVAAAPAVTVAAAPRPLPVATPPGAIARVPDRATCDDCARVESVRLVEAPPRGPLGTLPDKFARAVLGDELGEAHTQRMRRLLDTLAGRDPSRPATRGSEYEVVLRASDGRTQVRRYDGPPPFAPGAIVRLGGGRSDPAAAPF